MSKSLASELLSRTQAHRGLTQNLPHHQLPQATAKLQNHAKYAISVPVNAWADLAQQCPYPRPLDVSSNPTLFCMLPRPKHTEPPCMQGLLRGALLLIQRRKWLAVLIAVLCTSGYVCFGDSQHCSGLSSSAVALPFASHAWRVSAVLLHHTASSPKHVSVKVRMPAVHFLRCHDEATASAAQLVGCTWHSGIVLRSRYGPGSRVLWQVSVHSRQSSSA